jgi:hypothetical protein
LAFPNACSQLSVSRRDAEVLFGCVSSLPQSQSIQQFSLSKTLTWLSSLVSKIFSEIFVTNILNSVIIE